MRSSAIVIAALPALLTACGGHIPPVGPSSSFQAHQQAPEKRWPTSNLDIRLCPDPEATRLPYTGCTVVKEPFTVTGRAPSRSVLAYAVTTESGKTGFIPDIDYFLSEDTDKRAERLKSQERSKAAKADCDRRGGVSVGMTRAQVYASCWGKPQKINTTTTAGGDHEQLVYAGYNYLYLRNGVLTSIQTSK